MNWIKRYDRDLKTVSELKNLNNVLEDLFICLYHDLIEYDNEGKEKVKEVRRRIMKNGGGIAYITKTQERIKKLSQKYL